MVLGFPVWGPHFNLLKVRTPTAGPPFLELGPVDEALGVAVHARHPEGNEAAEVLELLCPDALGLYTKNTGGRAFFLSAVLPLGFHRSGCIAFKA